MGNTLSSKMFALSAAVAALAACSTAEAADAPSSPAPAVSFHGGQAPDISGLWLGTFLAEPGARFAPDRGPVDGRGPTSYAPWPLPYTPAFQKTADERAEMAKAGRQLGDTGARCLPGGMPGPFVGGGIYPVEIVQTPGAVIILRDFPFVIWTDGRPHPKDLAPSYAGHSIGYWLGDTLFVDTVGGNGATPLDNARHPHSAKLHMKTTIQRVSKDVLNFHPELYDEDAFTEPVVTTNIWHRKAGSDWEVLETGSCFENNHELTTSTMPAGFPKY